jgi:RNA polymerase sigma factor (sigma-70 family)
MSDAVPGLVDLAKRITAGDQAAVTEFVDRLWPHLIRVVARKLNARPELCTLFDADDFANAALFEFLTRRVREHAFENDSDVMSFVFKIAQNMVLGTAREYLDRQKRDIRRCEHLDPTGREHEPADPGPTPAAAAEAKDEWEHLLETLPWTYRRVVELRRQGYLQVDIARETGIAERTVRRILDRAWQSLQAPVRPAH